MVSSLTEEIQVFFANTPKYDIFPNQLKLNQYGCQPWRTPKWKQFQFCLLSTSLLIESCPLSMNFWNHACQVLDTTYPYPYAIWRLCCKARQKNKWKATKIIQIICFLPKRNYRYSVVEQNIDSNVRTTMIYLNDSIKIKSLTLWFEIVIFSRNPPWSEITLFPPFGTMRNSKSFLYTSMSSNSMDNKHWNFELIFPEKREHLSPSRI